MVIQYLSVANSRYMCMNWCGGLVANAIDHLTYSPFDLL